MSAKVCVLKLLKQHVMIYNFHTVVVIRSRRFAVLRYVAFLWNVIFAIKKLLVHVYSSKQMLRAQPTINDFVAMAVIVREMW